MTHRPDFQNHCPGQFPLKTNLSVINTFTCECCHPPVSNRKPFERNKHWTKWQEESDYILSSVTKGLEASSLSPAVKWAKTCGYYYMRWSTLQQQSLYFSFLNNENWQQVPWQSWLGALVPFLGLALVHLLDIGRKYPNLFNANGIFQIPILSQTKTPSKEWKK